MDCTEKRKNEGEGAESWRLLARRTKEMTDVMLHIAADAVVDFPEDVERVERVRQFLFASLDGASLRPPPTGDLLFVLGALIDAFDLHCGEPGMREAIEGEIDELLARSGGRDAVAGTSRDSEGAALGRVCSCCGGEAVRLRAIAD